MAHYSTDEMIEQLINGMYDATSSARQKHVFREALRSLVRLAKTEQMLALRNDVRSSIGQAMDIAHQCGNAE